MRPQYVLWIKRDAYGPDWIKDIRGAWTPCAKAQKARDREGCQTAILAIGKHPEPQHNPILDAARA